MPQGKGTYTKPGRPPAKGTKSSGSKGSGKKGY